MENANDMDKLSSTTPKKKEEEPIFSVSSIPKNSSNNFNVMSSTSEFLYDNEEHESVNSYFDIQDGHMDENL